MNRVVFVNALHIKNEENNRYLPLGTLSIATVLKNNNYDVHIIDFNMLYQTNQIKESSFEEPKLETMCNLILELKPSIVGFYTMCNSYHNSVILSKYIKEKNNDIKIMFGGPHASLTAEKSLEAFPWIDCIGIGEGEDTIVDIVEALLKEKDFNLLKGVAYRKNGEVICNNEPNLISNLDELPLIDYTLVNLDKSGDYAPIEVGRGCPFSCIYCSTKSFWKRKFRLKSIDRIFKEIYYLKDNFNKTKFDFIHDTFTVRKSMILEFCERAIREKLDIKWGCSTRLDLLDENLICKMKEAGCASIFLGIETGSPRMQKKTNKNLDLSNVYKTIDILMKYKMKVRASFIYGFPDETIDDVKLTLEMMRVLTERGIEETQIHLCTILPGTEIYNKTKDSLKATDAYSDLGDSARISEASDLIQSYPEIFPHFYDFDSELRVQLKYLDRFVDFYIAFMRKFLPTVYKVLMNYYHNDLLALFFDFRNKIPDFANTYYSNEYFITKNNPIDSSYMTLLRIGEFIRKMDFSSQVKDLLCDLYEFELQIFRYMFVDKEKNEKHATYNHDVYKVRALGFNENENYNIPVSLKFYRAETGNLKIKRDNNIR